MSYNLTANQQELLRWIVQQVRDGNLSEEFTVTWKFGGVGFQGFKSGEHPEVTRGMLDALAADKMLIDTPSYMEGAEVARTCVLRGKAYEAVDSDFAAPEASLVADLAPSADILENVLLEQEQIGLLSALAEAARNLPRNQRRKFVFLGCKDGSWVRHPGLPGKTLEAYRGDIEILGCEGLLMVSYGSHGTLSFDVTPLGFKYYEYMKQRTGQSVQRIETTIREYLDADCFQNKYPKAYQKWADAEAMLWGSDSERQFTTIGHLCREAMQEFATALVDQYQPLEVDKDKAHTRSRIKAVLVLRTNQLGKTEKPFLDALYDYWEAVDKLVQRQEHGAQKEGEPLVWEDGRRVVFQTAVVMFEVDRALSRTR